jgi:hypothetical protein
MGRGSGDGDRRPLRLRFPFGGSSAFSAFLRPQRPNDVVPASLWTPLDTTPTVPDVHTDRRVATSKSLAVYLVHAAPDFLCVIVQDLPGQGTGGQGCDHGPSVIARGMVEGWEGDTSDPTSDHTAVLVPNGYTAAITRGKFELAGQGVLVVQGDGVEVTMTNNDGRTIHLSMPARSQR